MIDLILFLKPQASSSKKQAGLEYLRGQLKCLIQRSRGLMRPVKDERQCSLKSSKLRQ
jgi:hypothetical protein